MDLDAVRRLTKSNAWLPTSTPRQPGETRLANFAHKSVHSSSILSGLYWVPKAELAPEDFASLTLTPKLSSLAPKSAANSFSVCVQHPRNDAWVGVPKFWGLSTFGKPKDDQRCDGATFSTSGTWNQEITLRPEQELALENATASLETWGGAFVIADCGFGEFSTRARHTILDSVSVLFSRVLHLTKTFSSLQENRAASLAWFTTSRESL